MRIVGCDKLLGLMRPYDGGKELNVSCCFLFVCFKSINSKSTTSKGKGGHVRIRLRLEYVTSLMGVVCDFKESGSVFAVKESDTFCKFFACVLLALVIFCKGLRSLSVRSMLLTH